MTSFLAGPTRDEQRRLALETRPHLQLISYRRVFSIFSTSLPSLHSRMY